MKNTAPPSEFRDDQKTASRFLSIAEVLQLTGLSPSSVRRLEQAGQFPRRISLSARRVAWLESEVRLWITWRCSEGRQK